MNSEPYLGRCEFPGDGWAKLEVLAAWDREQGWREIDWEARRTTFPKEGLVYCGEATMRSAIQDSLWIFETSENPRYGDGAREKFKAHRIAPAIEVLDFRSHGGSENVRASIVELGLDLEHPPTSEVVVRLTDDTCVVLKLTRQSTHDMRWQPASLEALRQLPIQRFDKPFDAGSVNGRVFLPPHSKPNHLLDIEDWSPDNEYLERLLRRVKKAEPLFGQRPSKAEIEQLISKLRNARALSLNSDENKRLRRRLDAFLPMLADNIATITEIVEQLMDFPTIKDALGVQQDKIRSAMVEEFRKELGPRIRAEIETSLATMRAARDSESAELEAIQQKVQQTTEQIRNLARARDDARSLLASELNAAMSMAQESSTADRLAELAAAHAIHIRKSLQGRSHREDTVSPPWLMMEQRDARFIEKRELPSVLKTIGDAFGVENTTLTALDVLARAAQIPVLFGPDVQDVMHAYAFSIAGGDVHRHRVDPTTIAPDDLWRHPGTQEPTAVAHAWRAAEANPERSILLVVDGIDLAPSEFWFDTWCDVVRSDRKPPNLIVVTTLSETTSQLSRKSPVELFLEGSPLRLQSRKMSVGEHLKSLLSAEPATPTVLRGMARSNVDLDEKRAFALAVAAQEIRSQSFLRRALSVHSVARDTYGDEIAAAVVNDFICGLGFVEGPRSSTAATDLIEQSVESLRALLAARS